MLSRDDEGQKEKAEEEEVSFGWFCCGVLTSGGAGGGEQGVFGCAGSVPVLGVGWEKDWYREGKRSEEAARRDSK